MRDFSLSLTGHKIPRSILHFGAGLLAVGLTLSASAKDEGLPTVQTSGAMRKGDLKEGSQLAAKAVSKAKLWYQTGVASWYGLQFQGRKTAAGERFDMNGMTCAHPTLPMGTWLRVTNLKNRRSAFVRVNDRGPLLEGRIVDLSRAAASALGMGGKTNVRLEPVRPGDPELAAALVAQLHMPAFGALAQ